jgi:hypothetical protein
MDIEQLIHAANRLQDTASLLNRLSRIATGLHSLFSPRPPYGAGPCQWRYMMLSLPNGEKMPPGFRRRLPLHGSHAGAVDTCVRTSLDPARLAIT